MHCAGPCVCSGYTRRRCTQTYNISRHSSKTPGVQRAVNGSTPHSWTLSLPWHPGTLAGGLLCPSFVIAEVYDRPSSGAVCGQRERCTQAQSGMAWGYAMMVQRRYRARVSRHLVRFAFTTITPMLLFLVLVTCSGCGDTDSVQPSQEVTTSSSAPMIVLDGSAAGAAVIQAYLDDVGALGETMTEVEHSVLTLVSGNEIPRPTDENVAKASAAAAAAKAALTEWENTDLPEVRAGNHTPAHAGLPEGDVSSHQSSGDRRQDK